MLRKFWADENGQGMVEYGLIIALVVVAAIAVLGSLGENIVDTFKQVIQKLSTAAPIDP